MATVFLVTEGDYSAYHVVAAFSSRANAAQFIAEYWSHDQPWGNTPCIEAYPLDRWQAIRHRRWFRLTLTDQGEVERITPLTPSLDDPEEISLGVTRHVQHILVPDSLVFADSLGARTVLPTGQRVDAAPVWTVTVEATDADHAVKIATEQWAMAKAQHAGMT